MEIQLRPDTPYMSGAPSRSEEQRLVAEQGEVHPELPVS